MNSLNEVYLNECPGGDITIYQRRENKQHCQPIGLHQNFKAQPWVNACYELAGLGYAPCPDCNMVGAAELLFNTLMEKFKHGQL